MGFFDLSLALQERGREGPYPLTLLQRAMYR